jgi:hypothetical protein
MGSQTILTMVDLQKLYLRGSFRKVMLEESTWITEAVKHSHILPFAVGFGEPDQA